ncbi:MAG: MarR family transcriptional regulator [Bacillaceae bacterium]|nr:MarR family transcriptional regulator [Bacillaceae bacterium]
MKGEVSKIRQDSSYVTEQFRYIILATQRLGSRLLQEEYKKIGISSSQSEVIQVLKEWEPISLKKLGELLLCEEGSPSRLIDRMVKAGFINKYRSEEDSRYVLLELSEKGREIYEKIVRIDQEFYKKLENIFSEDEMKQVNQLLSKFLMRYPVCQTLRGRNFLEK